LPNGLDGARHKGIQTQSPKPNYLAFPRIEQRVDHQPADLFSLANQVRAIPEEAIEPEMPQRQRDIPLVFRNKRAFVL
jgi:hypothetical protein